MTNVLVNNINRVINDKVVDFPKRKPALFPCNLIQLYSSSRYSAFDEHNRRYVVLAT